MAFYKIRLIILYKIICYGLNINTQVIIGIFVNKTPNSCFFISYNNMNIYEGLRD